VRSTPSPIKGQVLFAGAVYDREVRRLPRPLVLHFVTVDLATQSLRFLVTPPDYPGAALPLRGRTTTVFLRETGADLAINGDFYYPWTSNTALDYYPHAGDGVTVQGYASSKVFLMATIRNAGICLRFALPKRGSRASGS
jgi:hypothetical protein